MVRNKQNNSTKQRPILSFSTIVKCVRRIYSNHRTGMKLLFPGESSDDEHNI